MAQHRPKRVSLYKCNSNCIYWLQVDVTWWYRTERPMYCGRLLIYCEFPSSNHSRFIHQCSLVVEETSSSEAGSWRGIPLNLAGVVAYLCHSMQCSSACRKILRHGVDGFTSPLKVGVLWTFCRPQKSIAPAGFEPSNIRSNVKHANHYTTEAANCT
jgi:hypothetical protein